jgi:hypothetical protein
MVTSLTTEPAWLQCACVLMDLVDPNLYITMLPEAMKKVDHEFNKAKILELYNTIDFIGISSYAGKAVLLVTSYGLPCA